MAKGLITALVVAAALAGCGTAPVPKFPRTVEAYQQRAVVRDDPMATEVRVTLDSPFTASSNPSIDVALVSVIGSVQRRSRAVDYTVTLRTRYRAPTWHFLRGATYMAADGAPTRARVFHRGQGDVGGCSHGTCEFEERAGFVISAAELEAAIAAPDPHGAWRVRFETERAGPADVLIDQTLLAALLAETRRIAR